MGLRTTNVLILSIFFQLIQGYDSNWCSETSYSPPTDQGLTENAAERKYAGEKENDIDTLRNGGCLMDPWIGQIEGTLSSPASDSVHTLRPSEIKVVAMMGAALTATEGTRQLASISKDPNPTTQSSFPDILKSFNPDLVGYSPGSRNFDSSLDQSALNGKAEDLPGQALKLVKSLKNKSHIDFQRDWKLITVYIGVADLCAYCTNKEYYSPENVVFRIKEALDILYQEVPRAFVNVVEMQNIDSVLQCHDPGLLTHEPRNICECLVKLHNSGELSVHNISRIYRNALQELVYSGIYEKRKDYTVVLQPFLGNLEFPLTANGKADLRYLSPDGLRFSVRSRSLLARGLWNNMLEPVGQKNAILKLSPTAPQLRCPTQERPYLFTYQNSDYGLTSPTEARQSYGKEFGSEVTCIDREPSITVPTSVHQLRPADIKVIAALGDSLTAGNGAGAKPNDLIGVITQFRGLSWSIGGDNSISTVTTLTNILREFNPLLFGYSSGVGNEGTPQSFLNRAIAGAVTGDLMGQVRKLLKLMKNDSRINFQEDWKIITLFIGGNDLCDYCKNTPNFSPDNFIKNIQEALDTLHSEVPRAFVNLVTILNIVPLRELFTDTRLKCPQILLKLLCKCVVSPPNNSTQLSELQALNLEYQKRTHLLVESGRYNSREDFTVVIQPFLENTKLPRDKNGMPDKTYFAPDCFHFNVKAHSQVARGLWKNLLEPVGWKTTGLSLDNPISIACPSKDYPYLKTYRNSNSEQKSPVTTEKMKTTGEPSQVYGSELLCKDKAPSDVIPKSVHSLRPADVKVIGAVGDSLTAGNGIGSKPNDVLDVLTQYRGLSFSIGGDGSLKTTTTLPNILREFNSNLTGFSTGKGNLESPNVFLNQAFPGALVGDLAGQVRRLVDIMKNNSKIDFQNDWKIINLFIGGNDLCNYCTDSAYFSAINFAKRIEEALDILHNEVQRVFVNLIEVLQLIPLRRLYQDQKMSCPRALMRMLCYCVVKPSENSPELEMMSEANRAYQHTTRMLVESGKYNTREDFTVVLQPFFHHMEIPMLENGHPDTSFFAPDCFHLSRKFHSQVARSLWNNMLQPVGEKSNFQDVTKNISLSCPSQACNGTIQEFCRYAASLKRNVQGFGVNSCTMIYPAGPLQLFGGSLQCKSYQKNLLTFVYSTARPTPGACCTQDQPFLRTFKNSNYTYQGAVPTVKPPGNWGSDLSCSENLPSETVPTSVHRIRPADVQVIAALGDSISVGFGARAKNLFQLKTQYQGVSWSIGGDKTLETVTTLPNILKKFNPNIYGFSSGIGKRKSKFNVAVPGSKANDMSDQARTLIQLMKNSSQINFEKDWKVITLFIGANDLCDYCMNKETYSADNYVKHIQEALDILQKEVPRAFVNIMQLLEMNGIRRIKKNTIGCALLQKNICPCFLKMQDNSPELNEMLRVNREYQTKLTTLIYSGKYDASETFTVVLQPYFTNTIIPLNIMGLPDLDFFSVDCFHLSERGQAEMAIGLWNNMLEPVGHKQNYNNFTYSRNKLKCPNSDSPYLFTHKNSKGVTPEEPEATSEPKVNQRVWVAVLIAIAGVLVGATFVLVVAKLRFHKCRRCGEKPLEMDTVKA